MAEPKYSYTHLNQSAMKYGLALGAWAVTSIVMMTYALVQPSLGFGAELMFLGSPFFAGMLTFRFRRQTMTEAEGFSFGTGFSFTLLTGIYATLWVMAALIVLTMGEDGGMLTRNLLTAVQSPEYKAALQTSGMLEELNRSTNGKGIETLVSIIKSWHREDFCIFALFANFFLSPILSTLIGLAAQRAPRR